MRKIVVALILVATMVVVPGCKTTADGDRVFDGAQATEISLFVASQVPLIISTVKEIEDALDDGEADSPEFESILFKELGRTALAVYGAEGRLPNEQEVAAATARAIEIYEALKAAG